jgi:hypothetical protein
MAETYFPILPGNIINRGGAYPLPNPDFKANKRGSGDPRDRNQQAWLTIPGYQFVRKVGYARITDDPGTEFDVVLPSTNTEQATDKHIADVKGLFVPEGAMLYRIGVRVEPKSRMPGTHSAGPRGAAPPAPEDSGLVGTPDHMLVFGSALPAAAGPGLITDTAAHTDANATLCELKFGADGRLLVPPAGIGQVTQNSPWDTTSQPTTADMSFKLYAADATGAGPGDPVSSDFLGGVFITCEVTYMVSEAALGVDELRLPGVGYSGVVG